MITGVQIGCPNLIRLLRSSLPECLSDDALWTNARARQPEPTCTDAALHLHMYKKWAKPEHAGRLTASC